MKATKNIEAVKVLLRDNISGLKRYKGLRFLSIKYTYASSYGSGTVFSFCCHCNCSNVPDLIKRRSGTYSVIVKLFSTTGGISAELVSVLVQCGRLDS
ncbi:hypothetical protein FKM82_015803 [Ascaphus truei]